MKKFQLVHIDNKFFQILVIASHLTYICHEWDVIGPP